MKTLRKPAMGRPRLHPIAIVVAVGAAVAVLAACASMASGSAKPPVTLAPNVDLPRFMGDWYVIANIPTFLEKGAYAARESYRLDADGTIATTFRFRPDSFEADEKTFHSRGFVLGGNNAIWGQQYIWPIKADYRISYVSDDYGMTVITREKRDYVWIMARTPTISDAAYQRMLDVVAAQGYDTGKLQRVPQRAPG